MSLNDPIEPMSEDTCANLEIAMWDLRESNKRLMEATKEAIVAIDKLNKETDNDNEI